jgi:streptomycin 6-kinase
MFIEGERTMSSITLHSQSFRPARPLAGGFAARGLADAMTELAALLRSTTGAVARHLHQKGQDDAAIELRERAMAHLAANPSYAADLLAAADRLDTVVERA